MIVNKYNLLYIVLLTICPISLYSLNGYDIVELGIGSYPIIHNGQVAWLVDEEGYSNVNIMLYDGVKPKQITNNSYPQRIDRFSMHNGRVVWSQYSGSDLGGEIYYYDGGQPIHLTKDTDEDYFPNIHNDKIVWGAENTIIIYDINTASYVNPQASLDYLSDIKIYNGQVIMSRYDFDLGNIYFYDGSVINRLSSGICPDLHNGMAVWSINNQGIFIYDGKQQPYNISDNGHCPKIHNSQVVWLGFNGVSSDIYLYKDLNTIQITNNNNAKDYVDIHDGKIVWQEDIDGEYNYEIFLYDGETVKQITDNDFADYKPSIHNNQIAWVANEKVFITSPEKLYSISGKVTDLAGNPIEDVSIETGDGSITKTDKKGFYQFSALKKGTYTVTPTPIPGYTYDPFSEYANLPPSVDNINFKRQKAPKPGPEIVNVFIQQIGGPKFVLGNQNKSIEMGKNYLLHIEVIERNTTLNQISINTDISERILTPLTENFGDESWDSKHGVSNFNKDVITGSVETFTHPNLPGGVPHVFSHSWEWAGYLNIGCIENLKDFLFGQTISAITFRNVFKKLLDDISLLMLLNQWSEWLTKEGLLITKGEYEYTITASDVYGQNTKIVTPVVVEVPRYKRDKMSEYFAATFLQAAFTAVGSYIPVGMLEAEILALLSSCHLYNIAIDPDANYKQRPKFIEVDLPFLEELPESTGKTIALKWKELLKYQDLGGQFLGKYEGAKVAGDSEWIYRNLAGASLYQEKIIGLMVNIKELTKALIKEFQAQGFEITEATYIEVKEQILEFGLPEVEQRILRAYDFTDEEIENIGHVTAELMDYLPINWQDFVIDGIEFINEAEVNTGKWLEKSIYTGVKSDINPFLLRSQAIEKLKRIESESDKIGQAIEELEKTMASVNWIDECHLSSKYGKNVLYADAMAVWRLLPLIKGKCKNKNGLEAEIIDSINIALDFLLRGDSVLISIKTEEFNLTPQAGNKWDVALNKLNVLAEKNKSKGDLFFAREKPLIGIQKYRNAWYFSNKAMKKKLELFSQVD